MMSLLILAIVAILVIAFVLLLGNAIDVPKSDIIPEDERGWDAFYFITPGGTDKYVGTYLTYAKAEKAARNKAKERDYFGGIPQDWGIGWRVKPEEARNKLLMKQGPLY